MNLCELCHKKPRLTDDHRCASCRVSEAQHTVDMIRFQAEREKERLRKIEALIETDPGLAASIALFHSLDCICDVWDSIDASP